MLVREHMTSKVITIDAHRPVADATRLLLRHRIRQMPVLRSGQLVGIITHRDLRAVRKGRQTVASVMTAKPFVISPDAAIDEAARRLRTYKIGGLPVVEHKRLVGIITVSNVLDALVTLSGVSEPTYRIVATGGSGRQAKPRAARAVERGRGEIKWLHRDTGSRPARLHLRVKARRVDDVVHALESEGFEVICVVASPRADAR
jgi:acetoin utilization protein AcuB